MQPPPHRSIHNKQTNFIKLVITKERAREFVHAWIFECAYLFLNWQRKKKTFAFIRRAKAYVNIKIISI